MNDDGPSCQLYLISPLDVGGRHGDVGVLVVRRGPLDPVDGVGEVAAEVRAEVAVVPMPPL